MVVQLNSVVVQGPAAAAGSVAGPITAMSPSSVPDEMVLTQGFPGVPEDNTAQTRGLSPATSVGPYFAPSPAPSMVRNLLGLCALPWRKFVYCLLDRTLMMICSAGPFHCWLRHLPKPCFD